MGEILEKIDFRVEINEDSAFARAEGFDQGIMEEKLRLLGLSHYPYSPARKLVMSNDASITKYRQQIFDDINLRVSSVSAQAITNLLANNFPIW